MFERARGSSRELRRVGARILVTTVVAIAACAALVPATAAGQDPAAEAERLRALRRANAAPIDFHALHYSIEGEIETRLFLMNPTADTLSVDLSARPYTGGEGLALGTYVIEPLRHVEISMREALTGFERGHANGRLVLSLLGDPDALQGWAVVLDGEEILELPLLTGADMSSTAFTTLWHGTNPGGGGERAEFRFLNVSDGALEVMLTAGGEGPPRSETLTVDPGSHALVERVGAVHLQGRGWLRVEHDGEPGDLLAAGLLAGRRTVSEIPMTSLAQARSETTYESLPLEAAARGEGRWLAVRNLADRPNRITMEAVDPSTGASLAHGGLSLEAGAFRSLPLSAVLPGIGTEAPFRLRIRAESPGLLARAVAAAPGSGTRELALFPAASAHPSGTYPLPALADYVTRTRIVNLGDTASTIGAQIHWDGGTYTLGPIDVPPGGSHEIDLETIAATVGPDVLGRALDRERPQGVLKWTVLSGSTSLLGRTEVETRQGSGDRFGFNCWGCCWQFPSGAIVPSYVELLPGETKPFEARVTYDTCSGAMGPFPLVPQSMTVPSPFTWNGSTLGASGPGEETIVFFDPETRITPTCSQFTVNVSGTGMGSSCKLHLRKAHNPAQSWSPAVSCDQQVRGESNACNKCYSCCSSIFNYNICKKKLHFVADQERRSCDTHCTTDVCG